MDNKVIAKILRDEKFRMTFVLSQEFIRSRKSAYEHLGMNKRTFYRKVDSYGIDLNKYFKKRENNKSKIVDNGKTL
jgi:DNA-binding NtrC family response regulator